MPLLKRLWGWMSSREGYTFLMGMILYSFFDDLFDGSYYWAVGDAVLFLIILWSRPSKQCCR